MRAAVLLGLLDGILVALLGAGVVLVYKAERYVNLANAQLGIVAPLVLAKLVLEAGVNWYVAFPVSVAIGAGVGAAARRYVLSRLEEASRTSVMIASLGLSQLLLAVAFFDWVGPDRATLVDDGFPLPFTVLWELDGLAVTARHVLVAVLGPAVIAALVVWLLRSTTGRVVRAAASNPTAALLAGIDVRRSATHVWAVAGGLSAIGAVLAAPGHVVLETQASGPLLLLLGLGSAALAGFTSLGGVLLAGLGLGIVDGVATHVGRSTGAGVAAVFAVVLAGLLVRSRIVGPAEAVTVRVERSDEPFRTHPALAEGWLVRHRASAALSLSVAIGVALPFLPWIREPQNTFVLATVAVFAVAALSLTLLTGWGGQVSLGQFAFVAIGVFTAARLAPRGWSLLATMLVAAAVGAAFAVVVGLPAVRSRGFTLAVTSLGLAVAGPAWLFRQPWLAPPGTSSVDPAYQAGIGRLATQRSTYLAVLAVLAVLGSALARLRATNPGRAVVAVRDNPRAAASFGLSPDVTRLVVFATSGALAAGSGALWLAVNRNVSVDVVGTSVSFLLLSAVVIGGVGSVAGAVLGSFVVFGLPVLLAGPLQAVVQDTAQLQLFLSGAGLIQTQVAAPGGLAAGLRRLAARLVARGKPEGETSTALALVTPQPARLMATRPPPPTISDRLAVRDLRVRFDGVIAVDGVCLAVGAGEVVGVVGPNGAGKSTLLDAISGLVPAEGNVSLDGGDVSAFDAARRARLGLGRGFQDARLFPTLTVQETVELALARAHPTGALASAAGAPWTRLVEAAVRDEADQVIARFGLAPFAGVPTDRLSTGVRRLCELACLVAATPAVLLLDEPTAGLAQPEAEALRPLLPSLAEEFGCAVLVVEHDLSFLRAVATRAYSFDGGRVVAEGPPASVGQAAGDRAARLRASR